MGLEGHGQHMEGGSGGMRTQREPGGGSPAVGRPGAGLPCRVPCTASAPEHKAQCPGWNVLAALQRGYKHASPEDALAVVYPAWSGGRKTWVPLGREVGSVGTAHREGLVQGCALWPPPGRQDWTSRPLRPPTEGTPCRAGDLGRDGAQRPQQATCVPEQSDPAIAAHQCWKHTGSNGAQGGRRKQGT